MFPILGLIFLQILHSAHASEPPILAFPRSNSANALPENYQKARIWPFANYLIIYWANYLPGKSDACDEGQVFVESRLLRKQLKVSALSNLNALRQCFGQFHFVRTDSEEERRVFLLEKGAGSAPKKSATASAAEGTKAVAKSSSSNGRQTAQKAHRLRLRMPKRMTQQQRRRHQHQLFALETAVWSERKLNIVLLDGDGHAIGTSANGDVAVQRVITLDGAHPLDAHCRLGKANSVEPRRVNFHQDPVKELHAMLTRWFVGEEPQLRKEDSLLLLSYYLELSSSTSSHDRLDTQLWNDFWLHLHHTLRHGGRMAQRLTMVPSVQLALTRGAHPPREKRLHSPGTERQNDGAPTDQSDDDGESFPHSEWESES